MQAVMKYVKAILTFDMGTLQEARTDRRMMVLSFTLLIVNSMIHAIIMAFTRSFDYFVPYVLLNPRLSTFSFSYPKEFSVTLFALILAFDLFLILGTLLVGMITGAAISQTSAQSIAVKSISLLGFISSFLTISSLISLLTFFSGYNPPILGRVVQIMAYMIVFAYLQFIIVTTDPHTPPWKILPFLWIYFIILTALFGIITINGELSL